MSSHRGSIEAMDVLRDPYAPTPPPGQDELPSEDGVPMETRRHGEQMFLLIDTLEDAWEHRLDFYVGGNMFVYFSELQSRKNDFRGPDVFIVLDTDHRKVRKSWVAWQEDGKLPDVVIELLSESTAEIDRGTKKRIYERVWRTGYYVLYDPESHALEGYELVRGEYVPIVRDARGDLPIASMGLALGLRPEDLRPDCGPGPWLRWIDANGTMLPRGKELAARAVASRDAAVAERDAVLVERDAVLAQRDAVLAEREALVRRVAELEAAGRRANGE